MKNEVLTKLVASKLQRTSCCHRSDPSKRDTKLEAGAAMPSFWCESWGSELGPSCLHSRHFAHWALFWALRTSPFPCFIYLLQLLMVFVLLFWDMVSCYSLDWPGIYLLCSLDYPQIYGNTHALASQVFEPPWLLFVVAFITVLWIEFMCRKIHIASPFLSQSNR